MTWCSPKLLSLPLALCVLLAWKLKSTPSKGPETLLPWMISMMGMSLTRNSSCSGNPWLHNSSKGTRCSCAMKLALPAPAPLTKLPHTTILSTSVLRPLLTATSLLQRTSMFRDRSAPSPTFQLPTERAFRFRECKAQAPS
ncbi:hypothetical protein JB92DRAFT_1291803 [Gautieria morchelliformis]|nr:hypothetical protein JB92DRAFT_1291803 [Gautieria morchelliformis]